MFNGGIEIGMITGGTGGAGWLLGGNNSPGTTSLEFGTLDVNYVDMIAQGNLHAYFGSGIFAIPANQYANTSSFGITLNAAFEQLDNTLSVGTINCPAPTITVLPDAGTGATASVSGSGTIGTVVIVTGTGTTSGDLATIKFPRAYAASKVGVILTAENKDSAQVQVYTFGSSTEWTISMIGPNPSIAYAFTYFCLSLIHI